MKPKPVHTETVCSACGLDWDRHSKATLVECVELLKADLAREKLRTTPQPAMPYPVPYPAPGVPWRPNPWAPYPGTNPRPLWTINPVTTSGATTTGSISFPPKTGTYSDG